MNTFKFTHVQFTKVDLKIDSFDFDIARELNVETFAVSCVHNVDTPSINFGIRFTVALNSLEKDFTLSLGAVAHFETDEPYDRDFLKSDFVKVNAPAIAFPYVRAFISNLTLNSGYNPVILPPYNFVEMNRLKELENNGEGKAIKRRKSVKS